MPFNINNFKTEISSNGILQNNKYQVYITPPPVLSGSSLINSSSDGQIETSFSDNH